MTGRLVIFPDFAVMELCPGPSAVANPPELICATLVLEETQVTESVISTVLPPCTVPVAVNCWVEPLEIEGLVGLMAIETKFANVIVTEVDPLTVPEVAVIVADPEETPVMTPLVLTVAIVASELDQRTLPVRVLVLPSSNVPVAVI